MNTQADKPSDLIKPILAVGRYQHYKGAEYQVVDVVCHSETQEWLVLYYPLYGNRQLWVRPYDMFIESVDLSDGTTQSRFTLVEPE